MDYSEYLFYIPDEARSFAADVLPSFFEDAAFESFEPTSDGIKAFAPSGTIDDNDVEAVLRTFVATFPMAEGISFSKKRIADRNWNEKWENDSFRYVVIADRCVVHSPLVTDAPAAEYDILISPKQAFGSGCHETTSLVVKRILSADMAGKSAVDVGCGTAILAILAKKKGAARVVAFDIDRWAYENARTNLELNGLHDVELRHGGFDVMPEGQFDYIFANITRNILLEGLPVYASRSAKGTRLFMSGFLSEDVDFVCKACREYGYAVSDQSEMDGWASVECVKL